MKTVISARLRPSRRSLGGPQSRDGSASPFLLCWPIDKGTTRFDIIHYAPDWGDGEPPEIWKAILAGFDTIIEEDTRNLAPMQRSLDSPGISGIPLNYQERRIWHVHETIDRTIGPERIPEELRVPQLLGPYTETADGWAPARANGS